MILRSRDCRRQMAEAELLQARQEALLLLSAEHAKDELSGIRRAAPRDHGEDEAGEVSVIEVGDRAPAFPLRVLRGV
ncbi:hypothetical protein ACVWYH_003123 [Bradyrhizobium sp. GM24.11]